jgi:hypothetical protein
MGNYGFSTLSSFGGWHLFSPFSRARFESREVRLSSVQSAVFAFICFMFSAYRHAGPRPLARLFETQPAER